METGVGEMMLTVASQLRRLGPNTEATKDAEAAQKAFSKEKNKSGQDKALQMISSLFVERGQPEKAPTRQDALKCLSQLTKATEMRKADEVKGFGPQFRSVNPHRVGRHSAVSASALPETEAWQMELGFRPGYMDSGLQVNSVFGFA